jgi:cytoskeleton protein RodZ
MGSFGERLRREREQRGITLDDVALTTKIRAGLLKALEDEKFEQLPGGIFNKGFVRAYARHLGIDEDQAVADYLVASGEPPTVRRTPDSANLRPESTEPRIQLVSDEVEQRRPPSSTPWGMKAGLLFLLAVGLAAWVYYHSEKRNDSSSQTTPVAANSTLPAKSIAEPASSSAPSASAAGSGASTPALGQSATDNSLAPGFFTVRIRADEECWMKITSDGKTEEVTLAGNAEKVVTAKDKILLRAGNVGALNVTFDGKKLPSQGEYGEVKTLSFGPKGLEVPAPSAASQIAPNSPTEVHP